MTSAAIPPFISALLIIFIGIYLIFKNPSLLTHRTFFYMCLSMCLWCSGYSFMYASANPQTALKWGRLGFAGIPMITFTSFYFGLCLLNKKINWFLLTLVGIASLFWAVLGQTHLIYENVRDYWWGRSPTAGSAYFYFLIFHGIVWCLSIFMLYREMNERKQRGEIVYFTKIKYALIAWLGGCLTMLDALPKYGLAVYPIGYIVALYWVFISGFALLRYKAGSEIYFTTRKLLIWSCYFVPVALLVGAGYYLISVLGRHFSEIPLTITLAFFSIGIGMIAHPLYRWLTVTIDSLFFPENARRSEKISELGGKIIAAMNWGEASRMILNDMVSLFGILKIALYLWNDETKQFELQIFAGYSINHGQQPPDALVKDHPLVYSLQKKNYLILDQEQDDFVPFNASVCFSIYSQGKLKGILILGEKESGLPYTLDEIELFCKLTKHISQAVEKFSLQQEWQKEFQQNRTHSKLIRQNLGPEAASRIIKVSQDQFRQGKRQHVSVLVSDLRGFTSASEQHAPEVITQLLNSLFPLMVEIIHKYQGTVDKFMGDAILAVFGIPVYLEDSECKAVQCAVEMQETMQKFNQRRREDGLFSLEMGIGIHSGEVVAGYIGSSQCPEYTVIGDVVNLASRLQGLAEGGQILVTSDVKTKVENVVRFDTLDAVHIKGKIQPIQLYNVLDRISISN